MCMTFDITHTRHNAARYVLNGAHRAVVFDLDDTLVPWEARHFASLRHVAGGLADLHIDGPDADGWFDALTTGSEVQVLWTKVERGELDQLGYHRDRVRAALGRFGLPAADEDVEALAQTYRQQMVAYARLEAGVAGLLAELNEWYRLGIITNGCAPIQLPTLERLGLNHGLFDVVLCANEVGIYKPNRAIYEQMLDILSLQPHQVMMVGDNYEHDVVGATDVGMDAIWINTRGADTAGREAASGIVNHVLELRSLVSHL
jgi:2-haloalkanoic acid dehalogenase type II